MKSLRQSTALNPLGIDFDRFLYAEVGADRHGGALSVVSALARVGVDPWEQAAMLARMPVDGAVDALCALFAKLPVGSGKPVDPIALATHLVTLLPRVSRQPATPAGATRAINHIGTAGDWPLALLHAAGLLALLGALLLLARG